MTVCSLAILDVGHGNCAVLNDSKGTVVIDAGTGATLLDYLRDTKVTHVAVVLLSHADTDHIAGLIGLLSSDEVSVGTVYVNSDSIKGSRQWIQLRYALQDARRRGAVRVIPQMSTALTGTLDQGDVRIEVLAPTPEVVMGGVGGKDLGGRSISTNAMSGVVRLCWGDAPVAIFAGDIDEAGMANLLEEYPAPHAKILVFPHHGGRSGKDNEAFAESMARAVAPEVVLFSIGRGKHGTPRPEIVAGVKKAVPSVRILCTQLSERCRADKPVPDSGHLTGLVARGLEKHSCCGGTVLVHMAGGKVAINPSFAAHQKFIEIQAPTALCRR